MAEAADNKKTQYEFQTEVKQLLHLMIHSLYSDKEIFLRELISNASDASDKLRFEALAKPELLAEDSELKIRLDYDKDAGLLTVSDNGIGMSEAEVIDHLGTIAKSGTKSFLDSLTGDQAKDTQLIGQFGVGFYASFMVADKVVVLTRRAGETQGVRWESAGDGNYSIELVDKPSRGTDIILHLKKDCKEFLEPWKIRSIVSKYSEHIALPIELREPPKEDENGKVKEKSDKFETINSAKALWTRSKSEISDEEYKEFYKHVSHDFQDPLAWSHNRVEGKQEYISLFYIPQTPGFDLWDREAKSGMKLYIQRVFIMDDMKVLPSYLRFIKGVIDSADLPLNISREILQNNRLVDSIRKASVKKILSSLARMAKNKPEDYAKFWASFGPVIKEGPAEDQDNKDAIAKLMRFATTKADTAEQTVSLEEYVGRMQEGQDAIYYITAESFAAAKNSPHLEIFRKKGIEVLLLSDRVDEWLVSHLTEFDGKTLKSVAMGDVKLDEKEEAANKAELEKAEKDFESVLKQVKDVLGDKIKEVRLSKRLTDSPACVVSDESGMSMHMQRLMASAGQNMPAQAPIFELNPEHRFVEQLKNEQDDAKFAEWSQFLLEQAMLTESGHLEDPAAFVKRVNDLIG